MHLEVRHFGLSGQLNGQRENDRVEHNLWISRTLKLFLSVNSDAATAHIDLRGVKNYQ